MILSTNFVAERERSECVAWRRFPRGEQIFIFYGARPNCELLVHNGFVPAHNEHDSIALRLGVSRADPLFERRCALLVRLALPAAGEFTLRAGADPVDSSLRAFLRVFSMNAEQLEDWLDREDCSELELEQCQVDSDVETRAWTFLAARVRLLLQAYPSTLEEDELLLTSRGISSCRRLAVQQRVAEKTLLRSTLDFTQQQLSSAQ
ncbi:hypothetical protein B566_EDAN010684 [Ephemera danica]|nr:hypothetical protein B566_EDAN010684 [Ephemera danica]